MIDKRRRHEELCPLDKKNIQTQVGAQSRALEADDSGTDLSRRHFVERSAKTFYMIPTLTLLGPATASAQGSAPCGGPGNPCPTGDEFLAAPEAPAPTE